MKKTGVYYLLQCLKNILKNWLFLNLNIHVHVHVLIKVFSQSLLLTSWNNGTDRQTYVHTAIFYSLFSKLQEGIKQGYSWDLFSRTIALEHLHWRIVNFGASAYQALLCLTGLHCHNVYKAVIVVLPIYFPLTLQY